MTRFRPSKGAAEDAAARQSRFSDDGSQMALLGFLLFLPGDSHVDQQERLGCEIGILEDGDLAVATLDFEKARVRFRRTGDVGNGNRDLLQEISIVEFLFAGGGDLPDFRQRLTIGHFRPGMVAHALHPFLQDLAAIGEHAGAAQDLQALGVHGENRPQTEENKKRRGKNLDDRHSTFTS